MAPEPGWLRAWWRSDRISLLRTVALIIALISYAFLWPRLIAAGGSGLVLRNIALHLFVTAWLMLVSIGVRSVGSREVLGAYLLGTFLVPTVVFFPLQPVISRIGADSHALGVWWVPPLEEFAILAAVALIAWRLYRQRHRRPGVMDLLVLGWAVGSGYAIHEDALYGRLLANTVSETVSGAFGQMYGWIYPTFGTGHLTGGGGLAIYHAGSGMFYGLVLATALLLRTRVRHIMWIVPVAWLYGTFSHGLHNHQIFSFSLSPWRYLTGTGHVEAVILVAAVPVGLLVDYGRRRTVALRLPPVGLGGVAAAARRGTSTLRRLIRMLAAARYHRGRNAAINAVWRDRLADPDLRTVEMWALVAFSTGSDGYDDGPVAPPPPAAWPTPPAPAPAPTWPPPPSA